MSTQPAYCKCSFTDPDGTVVAGEACELHPKASRRGSCDCCGERPWTHHVDAHQTSAQCETFACCECANCDGLCGWCEYEEAGPMDLEDQLDRLLATH